MPAAVAVAAATRIAPASAPAHVVSLADSLFLNATVGASYGSAAAMTAFRRPTACAAVGDGKGRASLAHVVAQVILQKTAGRGST